jgi:hypothetical protein
VKLEREACREEALGIRPEVLEAWSRVLEKASKLRTNLESLGSLKSLGSLEYFGQPQVLT